MHTELEPQMGAPGRLHSSMSATESASLVSPENVVITTHGDVRDDKVQFVHRTH